MSVALDEGCEVLNDVHCLGWPGLSLPQTLIILSLRIALVVPVVILNVLTFRLFASLHFVSLWLETDRSPLYAIVDEIVKFLPGKSRQIFLLVLGVWSRSLVRLD